MELKSWLEKLEQLRIKVLVDEITKKTGPLTKLAVCDFLEISLLEYDDIRTKAINDKEWEQAIRLLDEVILNSFYVYSFDKKINQGIQMYCENEITKTNSGLKLEVFVDINDYQKQLQGFDINNPERINIENEEDEITIIGDEQLEELGLEVDEVDG